MTQHQHNLVQGFLLWTKALAHEIPIAFESARGRVSPNINKRNTHTHTHFGIQREVCVCLRGVCVRRSVNIHTHTHMQAAPRDTFLQSISQTYLMIFPSLFIFWVLSWEDARFRFNIASETWLWPLNAEITQPGWYFSLFLSTLRVFLHRTPWH